MVLVMTFLVTLLITVGLQGLCWALVALGTGSAVYLVVLLRMSSITAKVAELQKTAANAADDPDLWDEIHEAECQQYAGNKALAVMAGVAGAIYPPLGVVAAVVSLLPQRNRLERKFGGLLTS